MRVASLSPQQRVSDWCAADGCSDAIVGGFYTRPEGLPLGELRLDGTSALHRPFATPWHQTRASLHVHDGVVTIDRREAIGPEPAGDLLQAGPMLVRGGHVVYRPDADEEGFSAGSSQFDSDITEGRHPRTALGVGDGQIIAAVADGRSPNDAGLTLGELAEAMATLGADAALNLDGGGSASLVCDGLLRNTPREGFSMELPGGRAISTVIAFDARRPALT